MDCLHLSEISKVVFECEKERLSEYSINNLQSLFFQTGKGQFFAMWSFFKELIVWPNGMGIRILILKGDYLDASY